MHRSPTATLPIANLRGGLPNTRTALASGRLCVGFLGGSITDSRTRTRWPEPLCSWFHERMPQVRLQLENAGIGATGSDLAAFRVARDVLRHGCDLVFVEYSVNDYDTDPDLRARAREGVLRQLLADGRRDVVVVHTYRREMQPHYDAGRLPPSVGDFERLAEYYGLTSVNMGLHALRQVEAGALRWEAWLPDGLHPEHWGSLLYANAVGAALGELLSQAAEPRASLPPPLNPECWERTSLLPWERVQWAAPWSLRRWGDSGWIDQVLHTDAPGARLQGTFEGTGLVAAFDFGATSSEVRWRIDGGPWHETSRERPAWAGDRGWFRPSLLAQALSHGTHAFELETLLPQGPGARGCTTDLAWLGVIA